jgi:uncharacterized membrane protein YeiH
MYILDLIGTFAFAVTGALKGKGKDLHIFGTLFLGIITAIGGGTIRDLIINRTPLFYLKDPSYLVIAVVAGVLTYVIPTFFKRWYSIFRLIDSIGLATFSIIGVSITYSYLFHSSEFSVLSFFTCVFLGMLTAFGGGIIRDATVGDVPLSLRKGSNYALSSFLGSLSFYFLMFLNQYLAIMVSLLITLFMREIVSSYGSYKKVIKRNKKSS